MDKFNQFIKDYDCTQYSGLPKFIKRRVDALKKIQLEQIEIQQKYYQKLQELELEFEKLYQPLYARRSKIINGEHEPTDEECQLPASLAEDEFNGDQENTNLVVPEVLTEAEEASLKSEVKGIPGFWLGCLVSTFNFSDSIEKYDRAVLRHLKDIELSYTQKEDFLTYKLDFHFEENKFFSNKVLSKTYYLKMKPDEKNPFSYEGFEVCKSEGSQIDWYPGKDTTKRTVNIKQKNKVNGQVRLKKKTIDQDSFFFFFKAPNVPENEDEIDEELGSIISIDFELGEIIRQSIIPKAPLYYTGYMMDEEGDEDDEDEDESDSDDSDDSDDESGSDDLLYSDSGEDADSLNDDKKAAKKKE